MRRHHETIRQLGNYKGELEDIVFERTSNLDNFKYINDENGHNTGDNETKLINCNDDVLYKAKKVDAMHPPLQINLQLLSNTDPETMSNQN